MLRPTVAALALALCALPIAAQGTDLVPLDDPSLPLFEHLVARGVVADPTPFVRPLRRDDALRALAAARPTGARDAAVVARLTATWTPVERGDAWQVEGGAGLQGWGQARRTPFQPAGPSGVGAFSEASGRLSVGPVAVVTRIQGERRLIEDPDWPGRTNAAGKNLAYRAADAYLAATFGRATVTLGTTERNWGPAGLEGLGVSTAGYPRPALALDLATSPIAASFVFTPLPSVTIGDGRVVERYFAAHRLAIRPAPTLELAVWETTILADEADQGTEALGTLFGVMTFAAQFGREPNTNTILGLEARWRPRPSLQLEFQFAGDDIRLLGTNREAGETPRPDRWAVMAGARGALPAGAAWRLHYERVTALAYRTSEPLENYVADGIGLVRLVPDYDRLTAAVSWPLRPGLLLTPTLMVQRQGEARLDQPVEFSPETPTFLLGEATTSARAGLGLHGGVGPLRVAGDVGITRARGEADVTGRLVLTYSFRAGGALR